MEVQVEWKNKGRSKEYGVLAVPVDEEIEVRLFWNGYNARPAAYIFKDHETTSLSNVYSGSIANE
jgi:hypothetical protein